MYLVSRIITGKSLYSLHMCMDAVVARTNVSECRDSWEIREICVINRFSKKRKNINGSFFFLFTLLLSQNRIRYEVKLVFFGIWCPWGWKHVWNGVHVCCVLSARIRGWIRAPCLTLNAHTSNICVYSWTIVDFWFSYNWSDMLSDDGAYIFASPQTTFKYLYMLYFFQHGLLC